MWPRWQGNSPPISEDIQCTSSRCFDREVREDLSGPFWGNRGKRTYKNEILYAEEPEYVIVRGGHVEETAIEENPFFHARGKKRDESPFFALRGKKVKLM